MGSSLLTSQIGQRISLPGHFDVPVILEDARLLGPDDSAGYECHVHLPDGSLEEAVISAEEVAAILEKHLEETSTKRPVDAEKLRLLIGSTRIRLVYTGDCAHKIADEATGEVFVKRVEVKGRLRGQPVRLTTNEWYKAQQLADTYWLYMVWDPLGASPELVRIHDPVSKLDHAKREIVAARFYEIPADAVQNTASQEMR